MEARAAFLIAYARAHHPVTVRGLYYQAEVHGVPGIDKTDAGYDKVQAQVLKLRRAGRLNYTGSPTRPAGCASPPPSTTWRTRSRHGGFLPPQPSGATPRPTSRCGARRTPSPAHLPGDLALRRAADGGAGFSSETFCFRPSSRAATIAGRTTSSTSATSIGRGRTRPSLGEKLPRFAREKRLPVIFDSSRSRLSRSNA